MKTNQYFSRKIKALTADKQDAPLFEELSDSKALAVVGGQALLGGLGGGVGALLCRINGELTGARCSSPQPRE